MLTLTFNTNSPNYTDLSANDFNEYFSSIGSETVAHLSSAENATEPATGRHCVLASADSGTVPAITSDCSPVADLLMRRRYFDLCVTASSRTMLTFENNVSCSSRDCSTIAFCRR